MWRKRCVRGVTDGSSTAGSPIMATDFDLTGKVAIVTGGNGGIGYGIAQGLAQAGADIVVAARHPSKNAQAVANLPSSSPAAPLTTSRALLCLWTGVIHPSEPV